MSSTVVLILGPSSDCIEICVPSPISVLRSLWWKTLHTDSVAAAKPCSCCNNPESFSRLKTVESWMMSPRRQEWPVSGEGFVRVNQLHLCLVSFNIVL